MYVEPKTLDYKSKLGNNLSFFLKCFILFSVFMLIWVRIKWLFISILK